MLDIWFRDVMKLALQAFHTTMEKVRGHAGSSREWDEVVDAFVRFTSAANRLKEALEQLEDSYDA